MAIFTSFFVMGTLKLVQLNDPQISLTVPNNEGVVIDLWKLGYFFAITEINPRIAS